MNRFGTVLKSIAAALLLSLPAVTLAQPGGGPPPPPPPGGGENPPTPQQVVERCLEHLRALTMQGQEAMREATGKTIDLVRLLSEKGAPDGAILRVGHAGKERVNRIAASHAARINAEAERCLRLLRALSAPPEAGQAILEARRRSLAGLREAAERSCMAIVRAVQAAIEDGEGEGEAAVSDAA